MISITRTSDESVTLRVTLVGGRSFHLAVRDRSSPPLARVRLDGFATGTIDVSIIRRMLRAESGPAQISRANFYVAR